VGSNIEKWEYIKTVGVYNQTSGVLRSLRSLEPLVTSFLGSVAVAFAPSTVHAAPFLRTQFSFPALHRSSIPDVCFANSRRNSVTGSPVLEQGGGARYHRRFPPLKRLVSLLQHRLHSGHLLDQCAHEASFHSKSLLDRLAVQESTPTRGGRGESCRNSVPTVPHPCVRRPAEPSVRWSPSTHPVPSPAHAPSRQQAQAVLPQGPFRPAPLSAPLARGSRYADLH